MTCTNPVAALTCGDDDTSVSALTCCPAVVDPPDDPPLEVVVTHRSTSDLVYRTMVPGMFQSPSYHPKTPGGPAPNGITGVDIDPPPGGGVGSQNPYPIIVEVPW